MIVCGNSVKSLHGKLRLCRPACCCCRSPDIESLLAQRSRFVAGIVVAGAGATGRVFCVTLLPDVRGADIVAQTLQASSSALLEFAERDYAASVFVRNRAGCSAKRLPVRRKKSSRLIHLAGTVLTETETLSLTAAEMIAPPAIEEFYGGLSAAIEAKLVADEETRMARAICQGAWSAGCRIPDDVRTGPAATDDAAIVLTHKLRWHDGTAMDSAANRLRQLVLG